MSEILNTSHAYRCIFIHVPKNAGTSIKNVLGLPGEGHVAWSHYAMCYPDLWQKYTSFAVVRNPWDRLVSAFHFAKKLANDYEVVSQRSFEECVRILHDEPHRLKNLIWHPQTRWVANPRSLGGQIKVDRVLRFETIDHDFLEFCRDLGIGPRGLPKVNTSGRMGGYRQYYDDQTRKLVERVYASDIETFGYSF